MNDRIVLAIVLACVLGSALVSSTDFLSQTAKLTFYGIGMGLLLLIGMVSLYKLYKKGRNKQKF